MLKPIIGLVAATLVTPALAEEYWVQYDYSTHECSVVQSTTHQTATRFPWSPPNDGSKPKGVLNGRANGGAEAINGGETSADGTNQAGPSPANTGSEAGTADNSNTTFKSNSNAASPNDSNSASSAGPTNNSNDFVKELAESWKRKAELAKENKIDVSKAFVGTAMLTREQAEDEMQIMRICGLKN